MNLEEVREIVKEIYIEFLKEPDKKSKMIFLKEKEEDSKSIIKEKENEIFERAKQGSRIDKEAVYERLKRIIDNDLKPVVNESTIDDILRQFYINYYENLYFETGKDKDEDFDNYKDLEKYHYLVDEKTYKTFVECKEEGLFKPSQDKDIIEYFEQFRLNEYSQYSEKLHRLAKIIYQTTWGFGIIEDFIDKITDFNEIGTNRYNYIWVQYKGKKRPLIKLYLKDQKEYKRVIKNLGRFSGNGDINQGFASDEFSLYDMQRVSIITPPLVRAGGEVIRIRNQTLKDVTLEEMVLNKSISLKYYKFHHKIKKGRPNIFIFGDQGTGKTTIENALIETTPYDRVQATQESNLELYSDLRFPLKNIVGFQSIGIDPMELYPKKLRMGLDHDHYGEIRTAVDAYLAKQTMTRQSRGSYSTVHYSDPESCIEGIAELICSHIGFNDYAYMRYAVAKMMNFLIQTGHNNRTGKYYVKNVYEVVITDPENLKYKIKKIFNYNKEKEELEPIETISEYTKDMLRNYDVTEEEIEEIDEIFSKG